MRHTSSALMGITSFLLFISRLMTLTTSVDAWILLPALSTRTMHDSNYWITNKRKRASRRRGTASTVVVFSSSVFSSLTESSSSSPPKEEEQATPTKQQQQQLGSFETLEIEPSERCHRRVVVEDWTARPSDNSNDHLVDFETAWDVQKEYLQQHLDRLDRQHQWQKKNRLDGDAQQQQQQQDDDDHDENGFYHQQTTATTVGVDRIILLEHQPIYTLGTASDESNILENNNNNIPSIRMDRGGEVTYHGPGQLTVYPVLDLRNYQQDIHWYVRALEQAVLVALDLCLAAQQHGDSNNNNNKNNSNQTVVVQPCRQDDLTGVWVVVQEPNKEQPNDNPSTTTTTTGKVAAVGIKCRRWITQHGVAINVESHSLPPFAGIVPCGLTGPEAVVTCVNDFCSEPVTVQQMAGYMKQALEQVFAIELVEKE